MTGLAQSATVTENRIETRCTNVKYPQVSGLKNKEAQDRINEYIRMQVFEMIPPEGCDVYQEIMGDYTVEVNKNGVLSIKYQVYTFRIHAANGLTVQKSITANLETGKVYQLHELFKPNSDYRIILTRMIQNQIKERDLPLIRDFTGITDYQSYYLTDNALVIYFQEIEYTPHYVGIPEFPIPYALIRNIISDEGPIARLLNDPRR